MTKQVFTVGHSTHSIDTFLRLLSSHQIQVVADVRSSPFSRFNPQFNREQLQDSLREVGIRYVFLGKELGARSDDPACYVNDKVQYEKLARTDLFQSGLARIIEGASSYQIAMMCAEKDPLDCHRTILVARELEKSEHEIKHILANGRVEKHSDSMARLVAQLEIPEDDMFRSREDMIADAYAKQAEKIAYDRSARQTRTVEQDGDSIEVGAIR